VKQKELERAIRRTIPKLPELDKLAVLREETDELDIDFVHGADSVVFKNKDGTYRQLETLNEEEGEEDEQTI
jgi:hypothetical protein